MQSFLDRHNNKLDVLLSQRISRAREALNKDTINEYFDYSEVEQVGVPSENVTMKLN